MLSFGSAYGKLPKKYYHQFDAKAGDVVIFDAESIRHTPLHDPYATLVYRSLQQSSAPVSGEVCCSSG